MRKISLTLICLALSAASFAQQLPHFSQYFNNSFLLNPAIAGSLEAPEMRTFYRNQWAGMNTGNPETMTLIFNGNPRLKSTGFGACLYNDRLGPMSKTGFNATYSYKVFFNDNKSYLSFGLSGTFNYVTLKADMLEFDAAGNSDDILHNGNFRAFYPNASFGLYIKNPNGWFGIAVPELINSNISPSDEIVVLTEKKHFYINAGKSFKSGDNNAITPMLLVKAVKGAPMQFTGGIKYNINKTFDLGAAYNSGDAVSLMFGYMYKQKFHFSYSYDITTSALHTPGATHEVTLAYVFLKKTEENTTTPESK